ncbi:MAG: hypothetical protein V7607_6336 [Solirubrobacteraceae bacterium]
MTTWRFTIGEAFSASDSVARFITVVAMMSNDWLRLMSAMLEIEDWHKDAEGLRIMSFRQQAALHHEAAEFMRDAPKRFPKVKRFIEGLEQSAQDACEQIVGGVDPKSEHYLGDWLANHRNVTFHYPRMHPQAAEHGAEEITEALKKAAEIESTITEEGTFGSVRFEFADEVVVQWLPDADAPERIAQLRESVMALARFVQQAARAYLEARPDSFTVE